MGWTAGKARGPRGVKTGGRKPGTPNKRTQDLTEILDEKGFCPAAELVRTYRRASRHFKIYDDLLKRMVLAIEGEDADEIFRAVKTASSFAEDAPAYLTIAEHAAKELMQYKFPKRKAIELTGKDGGPLDPYLRMTSDERASRIAELQARRKKAA